jgi:NAD(P)-dependent dehydrogenase (short-subunit alcohol dehydrogenase family)
MKTVVITGATAGIGFEAARAIAAQGMRVIGVGRSREKCDKAKAALLSVMPEANVDYVCGDLSIQSDVHAVADAIIGMLDGDGLWTLINNAGGVRSWYTTTADGYELQFALNHLAGFLLTHRLWLHLKKAGGRVIMTGSNSHKKTRIRWDDVMHKQHYSCLMAYKRSKLAGMLFAAELNRRQREVKAYVVDPGLVNTDIGGKDTGGIVEAFWNLRRRGGVEPEVPAQTYAYLCSRQPAPEGLYYHNCRPAKYSRRVDAAADAKRLFELSEQLCGIKFGGSGR